MRKFFYLKRSDSKHNGTTVEVPEEYLESTLRAHPTWTIIDETTPFESSASIEEAPKADTLECPLCGMKAATEKGLKVHKGRKHK